ncbi:MAG TPA: NfeD family protein [Gemmatimonadales bacterium]|jgi:membrane-bound serine protease (ClpP class)|nr:NfeD family protein [Gemmatimonadales bacterium]
MPEPSWVEALVRFLTHPLVSPLLLSLGVLGLVFELKAGAFGLGGLVSLLALGLFFGASYAEGLAGWPEALLLIVGLIFITLEVLVLPGFGFAGVIGLVCLTVAVVLAMTGSAPSPNDLAQALAILAASAVICAAVIYTWIRHLPTSNRFSGLLLKGAGHRTEGFVSAPSRPDLIGRNGVALTDLRPSGTAGFGEERLDVVTEGEYLGQGTAIEVVRSDGYRHVVRAAQNLRTGAAS